MKKQTILLFGILVATMSSCVYSLFPIYTEDTLVFKEELLGKWNLDNEGSYMLFEAKGREKKDSDTKKYKIEIKEGFTMSSDEPIFIMEKGKKIYDEDSIKSIMRERMAKYNEEEAEKEKDLIPPLELDIADAIKKQVKEDKLSPRDIEYEGSVTVYEKMSYQLTIYDAEESGDENDKKESYVAHLVRIGEDLFMDLYPVKEFSSKNISDNFFPVHTFYKVSVTDKEFTMTHFDLDKLNKLFESNLIRLRHESVDGTILITAQPKELQKFIDKYSDDESVFDFSETYKRAL